jgi:hypothetical protein
MVRIDVNGGVLQRERDEMASKRGLGGRHMVRYLCRLFSRTIVATEP